MLLKILHQLQPNFVQWQKPSNALFRWSKHIHNKSNMADSSHFEKKIEISPYLSNGTTFATVTYTGTLKSKPLLAIKIPDFKNPRWRTADSLKNRLVLTTVLPIRTKSGARTYHYTSSSPFEPHVQVKFQWCFGARFTKKILGKS